MAEPNDGTGDDVVGRPQLDAIELDRKKRRGAARQLSLLCAALCLIAVGITTFKIFAVGVPAYPAEDVLGWRLEAEIELTADGGPVRVSLAIPDLVPEYKISAEESIGRGFGFRIDERAGHRRAVWSARDVSGGRTLFYRTTVHDVRGGASPRTGDEPTAPGGEALPDVADEAARDLLDRVRPRSADAIGLAVGLIEELNDDGGKLAGLVGDPLDSVARTESHVTLLALDGIAARLSRGVALEDGVRRQPLREMLEVYADGGWTVIDPYTGAVGVPPRFVLWQRGGESLIEVTGAEASRIRFSAIETVMPTKVLAAVDGEFAGVPFLFSLYDLPVEEQNVFRILTLIPLGAFILCVFRNFVGLPTSGTFMPLLIALSFRETDLLTGLFLFVTIIAFGLLVRAYLARLNLLLVPRISAVVVVVILLMGVGVLLSARLDYRQGLTVTFFPFVVIAWTIERMSSVWEQEGPSEAVKQCAASLFVAALAYLVWQIRPLQHVLFTFTEVNLILLAMILLTGGYTGYRLSELIRFGPIPDVADDGAAGAAAGATR